MNSVTWAHMLHHSYLDPFRRSGKSTHISMISNSVTHLRSCNTAIAAIAENSSPISPVTLPDRRRRRTERRYRLIEWPPRDRRNHRAKRRRLHAKRRRLRIERRYCRTEWRVFDDVSQCLYHDVLLVVHNNVSQCFMMSSKSRNDRRPPIASGIATTPQGSAITPQWSAITPQKSAMPPQRSSISPRMWSHVKLHPEWRLE